MGQIIIDHFNDVTITSPETQKLDILGYFYVLMSKNYFRGLSWQMSGISAKNSYADYALQTSRGHSFNTDITALFIIKKNFW